MQSDLYNLFGYIFVAHIQILGMIPIILAFAKQNLDGDFFYSASLFIYDMPTLS